MKEILQKLAAYNVWANQKIINCIQQQEEVLWHQQTPSSFDTLHETLLHIWDAESVWWQRIKLQERIMAPSQNAGLSLTDVSGGLLSQSMRWEEWVKAAAEMALQHVFLYNNLRKEQFKQPVFETVLHVFNHSTYHRGQLVTMLRQLGVTNIPQTDFVVYCRNKK